MHTFDTTEKQPITVTSSVPDGTTPFVLDCDPSQTDGNTLIQIKNGGNNIKAKCGHNMII